MKRFNIALFIVLACFLVMGCASLQKAAKETTPAQVTQMQNTITPYAAVIPLPYVALGAPLIALLAAIGKNWWDDKHPTTKV
jgi:hypothetical protein